MKKYIRNIFLFACFVCLADCIYGWVCNAMYDNTQRGIEKRVREIISENTSEILIMGSSRAHYHYNPLIFSETLGLSCYNAGFDGQGILFSYGLLELMCKRHVPEIVIYDVSTFDIYKVDDNSKYIGLLKPYADEDDIRQLCSDIDIFLPCKLRSSLYRYNSEPIALLMAQKGSDVVTDNGFVPKQVNHTFSTGYDKNYDEGSLVTDSIRLQYFRKFINLCVEKNIKLIFVASPRYLQLETSSYYNDVKDIANKNNIPFWDYFSDSFFSKSSSLFYDVSHLNSNGADMFSKEIAQRIKATK